MKTPTIALRTFAVSALAALSVGSLSAATLTLNPASDNTIRSDNTTSNSNTNLLLVGEIGPANLRSLLCFDLSSPDLIGATINSVSLTLTVNDGSERDGSGSESAGSSFTINLNLLDSTFTETGATWATSNGSTTWTAGSPYSTLLSSSTGDASVATTGTSLNFGSNSDFISAVSSSVAGSAILNLVIKLDDESTDSRNIFRFTSSEPVLSGGVTAAFSPLLTIDYTAAPIPEPATFALLGGLAVLGASAVRRRRS